MKNFLKRILKQFGPGFITGASDDDPSGIGTYSQTGAFFGYRHLWLSPLAFPLMVAIQEMCGRIGMVTGKGLSALLKRHYPKWVLYLSMILLFTANTINIAADLGAMAASAQLIIGLPFTFWIVFMCLLIITLEVFLNYHAYARILKFLCLSLIAYIITAFIAGQDWGAVARSTFIPSLDFSKESIMNIVAFLGTSISPYLFYWQTSQEVEEEIEEKKYIEDLSNSPMVNFRDIRNMRIDTAVGMALSQITAFMIMLTTASTLHQHGITDIQTASQAAEALLPFAGHFAYLVFAIGIIGTGLLGVPVLAASSAYAISEAFSWKEGLNKKLTEAPYFYGVIVLSTFLGLIINYIGINPMKALYYAATLNGLLAPPLMTIILIIGLNKKIMGCYTNGKISTFFGIFGIILMGTAGILLLINL